MSASPAGSGANWPAMTSTRWRKPGGRPVPRIQDLNNMTEADEVWNKKGATLSDKSARAEYGLTQQEIVAAINSGKLRYRVNSIFGNPFLRLVRREVEALISESRGSRTLQERKLQHELARTEKQLRSLKKQVAGLEKRRSELLASIDRGANRPMQATRRPRA